MKIEWKKYPADIIICLIWSVALVPSIILNLGGIRIILGLVFIIFIPGYMLIFTLFPRRDSISIIERIALSFGLSIAVVPLVGLALNYTPWGIRLQPILASLILMVFILFAIGCYRWKNLPVKERFRVSIDIRLPKSESRMENILTAVLIISIVISISLLAYVIVTPHNGERFTEFYILGPDGKAEGYPTNLSVGENGTVLIGIVNHEQKEMNYTVEVWAINYSYQPEFDGKNDYVAVKPNESLNFTTGITIDTWVKPADEQSWNFLGKSESYIMGVNKKTIRFGIFDPDAEQALNSGYVIVSANGNFSGWNHIACTYDAETREAVIYLNGHYLSIISCTGGDGLISKSNSSLYIGKVWGGHFNGTIGYLRIYNRALSDLELNQNYNGNVETKGLVSEWEFDKWQDTIIDKIGDNDGKIHGTPWRILGIKNMWFMDKIEVQLNSTPVDVEKEWKSQWEYNYSFNFKKEGHFKLAFLLSTNDTGNFTEGNDYPEEAERPLHAYREVHLWITVYNKSFK